MNLRSKCIRRFSRRCPFIKTNVREAAVRKHLSLWVALRMFCNLDDSIDDNASQWGVKPRDIERLIYKKTGLSFKKLRKRLRIEEAKNMLAADPSISLRTLSEAVGYSDKSNFRRTFIEVEGKSPEQWKITSGRLS